MCHRKLTPKKRSAEAHLLQLQDHGGLQTWEPQHQDCELLGLTGCDALSTRTGARWAIESGGRTWIDDAGLAQSGRSEIASHGAHRRPCRIQVLAGNATIKVKVRLRSCSTDMGGRRESEVVGCDDV
jgi:hypothetical protein